MVLNTKGTFVPNTGFTEEQLDAIGEIANYLTETIGREF